MSNKEEASLITYCGLYCGDCHGYTGTIPDLARDLRKELRRTRYDKFAETISKQPFGGALRNYKECYEALGMMVKFRCKKGVETGAACLSARLENAAKRKR